MRRSVIVVAVLLFSRPATAVTGLEAFELWNRCAPIRLIVEDVDRNEVGMGLTREVIMTMVRSRLRAARLYTQEGEPYLYVNVNTLKSAFTVNFTFNKVLSDPITGIESFATTWKEGFVGRGDADFILSAGVSRLTDTFIDEYLRVNEQACKES